MLDKPGGEFVIAFEARARSFPGLVDRVIAAEQDPVVGQPVVKWNWLPASPMPCRFCQPIAARTSAGSGAVTTTWSKTGTTMH